MEERERLQEEFRKKADQEKDELKSTWIEKIDNTDQVRCIVLSCNRHAGKFQSLGNFTRGVCNAR